MSATDRPASARALRLAWAARFFVDVPEPLANAVHPIPAMAVFSLIEQSSIVLSVACESEQARPETFRIPHHCRLSRFSDIGFDLAPGRQCAETDGVEEAFS
jgi:hypothetical protein